MSFDGVFTRAVVNELSSLAGGRINKADQPFENEAVNDSHQKNYSSYFPPTPVCPIHLTHLSYQN